MNLLKRLNIDWLLVIGILVMGATSLLTTYSASGGNAAMIKSQGLRILLGFGIMIVVAHINGQVLRRWSPFIYGGGVVLLVAVLIFGTTGKGAQRWLDLYLLRFQPSEALKIAVPMMIAWYVHDKVLPIKPRDVAICVLIIAVPALLIFRQPDLGTAILVASAGIFAIFLAGISWKLIASTTVAGLLSVPLIWHWMQGYQKQRVLTFLNPESDPLNTGYHIIQSKIAIGSGGPVGKGWMNGTQSRLNFIPESSTDFIYAVFAEEFGFVGTLLLVLIYLFIVARGLTMAVNATETYNRILIGSLTLTFFVYFFVNIGMVSGLLPVVGVPLPLISFGGTSMVTIMTGFGIMMSLSSHRVNWSG